MRAFLRIVGSSMIGALILGSTAAAVATYAFYDFLFAPGHTDHQRGIAWFFVGASALGAAAFVFMAGFLYWIFQLFFPPDRHK